MRFCTSCVAQLNDEDIFCTSCGAGAPGTAGAAPGGSGGKQDGNTPREETRIVVDDYGYGAAPMGGEPELASVEPFPIDPLQANIPRTGTVMAEEAFMGADMGNLGTAPTNYRTQTQTGVAQQNSKGLYVIIGVAAAVIIAAVAILVVLFAGNSCTGTAHAGEVTVSFETNGGSHIEDKKVADGKQITSPTDPTREGYTFEGWYTDSNFTHEATFPLSPNSDTVLYAKWSEKSGDTGGGNGGGGTVAGESGKNNSGSRETVSLTVVGSDGSTRTADIHRDRASQRVFPDSNSRRLSTSEVAALSDAERCVAWNEIIAASNGYSFRNGGLADYFGRCSWYHRVAGASPGGSLSEAGSANVELLQSYTDGWWKSLAMY